MTPYLEVLVSDVRRAIRCYLVGVTVAAALGSIPMGLFPFPLVWLVGMVIGLPALLVILVLLAACQRSIHANLTAWCLLIPVGVVLIGGVFLDEMILTLFFLFGAVTSAFTFYDWTSEADLRTALAARHSAGAQSEVGP